MKPMVINGTYYWTKYESIIQSEIMQGIVSGEKTQVLSQK